MKAGSNGIIAVNMDVDIETVDNIIFTIVGLNTVQKIYPDDVGYSEGLFSIPLTQEDTISLCGGTTGRNVKIEAQVNFSNKAVTKTDVAQKYLPGTLFTKVIPGNTPQHDEDITLKLVGEVLVAQVSDEKVAEACKSYIEDNADLFKGEQGEKGEKGEQGEQGDNGKSAYDIAVEHGFEGTEEEWLESLKAKDVDTDVIDETVIKSLKSVAYDNVHSAQRTYIDDVSIYNASSITESSNSFQIDITDTSAYSGFSFLFTVPSEIENDLYIHYDKELLEDNENTYFNVYLLKHGDLASAVQIGLWYLSSGDNYAIPLSALTEYSLIGKEIKIALTTKKVTHMMISNLYVSVGKSVTLNESLEAIGQDTKTYNLMTLGDSITALGTGSRGWVKYFMEKINCNLVANAAVASAVWTDYSDTVLDGNPTSSDQTTNTLCNQVYKIINADYEAPDVILIAIGTNGGIDVNLTYDTIDATYYDSENVLIDVDSADRTTTTGAFRYANEKLHEKYPNALIFWCAPIMGYEGKRSAINSVKYEESIRKLTSYASMGFIDTNHCGINGLNELSSDNGEYLVDGLHPNVNGAKKIGYYNAMKVKPFLNTLFEEE